MATFSPFQALQSARLNQTVQSSPSTLGSPRVDYRSAFTNARDYWEFARETISAARAGSPDAEFYLWKAIEYCSHTNRQYVELDGKPLTIDESLQLAVKRNQNTDAVQAIYDRCHQFQDDDAGEFGDAAVWLVAAAKAGQPSALVADAERRLAEARDPSDKQDTPPSARENEDPHEFLKRAVATNDPEAIFTIGWYERLMPHMKSSWDGPRSVDALAWMYVGCRHGFDCSATAEWVTMSCVDCQHAESTDALIESIAGQDWPEVQQRALEISNALDAKKWEDLGW